MPTGSQFRQGPHYLNDPLPELSGILGPFINAPVVPTSFGPYYTPNLTGINTLTGTGYNALAAVPTTQLPAGSTTGFMVDVTIGGADQRWQLQVKTTQSGSGTVQPNDFNVSTNNKIWVQLQ